MNIQELIAKIEDKLRLRNYSQNTQLYIKVTKLNLRNIKSPLSIF